MKFRAPQVKLALGHRERILKKADAPAAGGGGTQRTQQLIAKALHEQRAKELLERIASSGPDGELAKQRAAAFLSGGAEGGAWLQASPAFKPNVINDDGFVTALKMRLGVPFRNQHTTCACGKLNDAYGHHAFRCTNLKGAGNTRHKWTNATLLRVIREAGLSAAAEVRYDEHFERAKGHSGAGGPEREHRADILLTTEKGSKVVIDTTVHHPIHASAHTTRGVAAKAAEAQKVRFIRERYMISGGHFIPFSLETYGAMGEAAKEFLRTLARNKAGGNNVIYAQLVGFYRSRIAVAVQRGNLVAINRWRTASLGGPPAAGGGG